MKKRPVNSRFPKLFLRFSLLFAILMIGGRGIFSEESNTPFTLLNPTLHHSETYVIRFRFKDFCVFVPTVFYNKSYGFPSAPVAPKLTVKEPAIMGTGKSSLTTLAKFLETHNPGISNNRAREIAHIYIQESDKEGVNYDVAFSQMCLETGFLKYGGSVKPQQNNFCGLGVASDGSHGLSFPSVRVGIRAHIQHLKAYATKASLKNPIVDTRFRFVKRGSIKTIDQLSGKWASDKYYSRKILSLMNRLYEEKQN
jgi:hypothetical protein